MAKSNVASWAVLATKFRSKPSSGFSRLMVGGRTPSTIAFTVATVSMAPAPPSVCPVTLLVLDIASFDACAPKSDLTAMTSALSPSGVLVPCALM